MGTEGGGGGKSADKGEEGGNREGGGGKGQGGGNGEEGLGSGGDSKEKVGGGNGEEGGGKGEESGDGEGGSGGGEEGHASGDSAGKGDKVGRNVSDGYIYAGLAPSVFGTMGRGPRIQGIRYRIGDNEYADVAAAIVLNSGDSGNGECKVDDFDYESFEENDTSQEVENIIENLNENVEEVETEEDTIPILDDKDEEERTLVE